MHGSVGIYHMRPISVVCVYTIYIKLMHTACITDMRL